MALISCTECGHRISDKAVTCPQCGSPASTSANPEASQATTTTASPHRKVGKLLGAGIVFMPFPFALFTFRKGYSVKARVLALGWFALVGLIALSDSPEKQSGGNTSALVSAPVPTQRTEPSSERREIASKQRKGGINRDTYEAIKNGMTKDQIQAMLGKPTSVTKSQLEGLGTTELWHFQDNSLFGAKAIDVWFQNGRVTSKNWTEL